METVFVQVIDCLIHTHARTLIYWLLRFFSSGSSAGDIYLFNRTDDGFSYSYRLTGHQACISVLAVEDTTENYFASGDMHGTIRLWNANSVQEMHVFEGSG